MDFHHIGELLQINLISSHLTNQLWQELVDMVYVENGGHQY
jgi:hypothetical protein